MQSTQSKLLLSALVAAQTVTALEIKETGLTQSIPSAQAQITLAQITGDGDIPEEDRAPGNGNDDDVHNPEESVNSALSNTALEEKIELLTDSQLAGLAAREAYMVKEIKFLTKDKMDQFYAIEETCREKLHAQKETSTKVLGDGFVAA